METDTTEITTPNGRKVVIRNYTTRGDDRQAQALLDKGIVINNTNPNGEPMVSVSSEATSAAEAKYVELLVQSIDGNNDDVPTLLDNLRSEDYAAVAEAVRGCYLNPKSEAYQEELAEAARSYKRVDNNKKTSVSDRQRVVFVCEHMHWTYAEYLSQPYWLVDLLEVRLGLIQ